MDNKDKFILAVVILLIFIAALVLFVIKSNNENFSISSVFIILAVVVIVFFAAGFVIHKFLKNKDFSSLPKEKSLPPAVTIEQARKIAIDAVKNKIYADYIDYNCLGETSEQLGRNVKSLVYTIKGKGLYENSIYTVVLNRHYPDKTISVLIDASEQDVMRAKILSASFPEQEPSVKKTVLQNPITGLVQTTEEVIRANENKETKKEDEL